MTADIEIDCLDLVRTLGQDEQIIYRPAAGRPRAMYAVVSRASDGPMPQVPVSGRTTNIEVAVVNDVANGIELGELDTGQDRMDVAPRAGDIIIDSPGAALSARHRRHVAAEAGGVVNLGANA